MTEQLAEAPLPRYNIPRRPDGRMMLSASQFRTYGTGAFSVAFEEKPKGCPRKYYHKYVLDKQMADEEGYPLIYGKLWHSIMHLMDEEGLTPDEALEKAFSPEMPVDAWNEARADLQTYLSRGSSPSDRFHGVAMEIELEALLYVDEVYGEVWYRGFLDWIGLDPEFPHIIHSVDYKTNRQPASRKQLDGDVQLKGYHWLIEENANRFTEGRKPTIVTHLDIIKHSDLEVTYSRSDIEDWHSWAVAMARKILRDNEHEPITNTWCSSCPVRDTCPAFEGLPMEATAMEKELVGLESLEAKLEWADRANTVRLSLEKAVKAVKEDIEKKVRGQKDPLSVGPSTFMVAPDLKKLIDLRRLHGVLGNEGLYSVCSTSETKLKEYTKDWEPYERSKVLDLVEQKADGTKVIKVREK